MEITASSTCLYDFFNILYAVHTSYDNTTYIFTTSLHRGAKGGIQALTEKITICGSEVNIEILSSATKHGQSKEDILTALEQSIYDETLESEPNKTLSIGYDSKARLLEIIFHVVTDDYIVVFHSMPCRKYYIERMMM